MSESVTSLWNKLRPLVVELLSQMGISTAGSSGGAPSPHALNSAHHTGSIADSQAPQFLKLDGSRTLTGNLTVASGITLDGVDLSAFKTTYDSHAAGTAAAGHTGGIGAHDHLTAGAGGDLTQYAHTDGAGTRSAYQAERLNKSTLAGNGLTGGGLHTADVTLNVGAGDGISVAGDSVAVDNTVVRTTRLLTSGNGLTGGGDLSANRTLAVGAGYGIVVGTDDVSVDTSTAFEWDGVHSFNAGLVSYGDISSAHVLPLNPDQYDVGRYDLRFRKLHVSEIAAVVFAENTVFPVGGGFIICKDQGALGAAAASAATTMDFSKAMTPNDFVVLRGLDSAGAVAFEVVKVGTLSAGTTYNVSRNQDLSGANNWPEGSVWAAYGTTGNGRIELSAYGTPMIQMITRTGTNYADEVEELRLGDLGGAWGVPAGENYGLAIGRYASGQPNLVARAGSLKLRNHTTDIITLDGTGAAIDGVINIGTNGGIFQGTGTFATPTTGLKFYNSGGIGLLAGYLAGVVQARFNASGELEAGGGVVKLNATGIEVTASTSYSTARSIKFKAGSTLVANLRALISAGPNYHRVELSNESQADYGGYADLRSYADGNVNNRTAYTRLMADQTTAGVSASLELSANATNSALALTATSFSFAGLMTWGGTSFPASPSSGQTFYRTDFRAWFHYDSLAWQQISVGAFASFPASPVLNLRVHRTDYDLTFFYDGSYWLTINEYPLTFPYPRALHPISTNTVVADTVLEQRTGLQPYITDMFARTNVQTTNSGVSYWSVTVTIRPTSGASTTVWTFNTSADTASTNVIRTTTPNVLAATTDDIGDVTVAKAGSTATPGNLFVHIEGRYRLRAT